MDQEQLTPFEAFDLAVTRMGGQSAIARVCGCTPSNIAQLLSNKSVLPAEYVLKVEAATRVSREQLRPDIYPPGLQPGAPFNADPLEGPLAPSPDGGSCEGTDKLQASAT